MATESQSVALRPSELTPETQAPNNVVPSDTHGSTSPGFGSHPASSTSSLADAEKVVNEEKQQKHRIKIFIAAGVMIGIIVILLSTLLTLLPQSANSHRHLDPNHPDPNNEDPLEAVARPVVANGMTVNLGYGSYRGVNQGNGVSYWLGMRYAAPPTGQRRFAAPEPPENFDGVQDATTPMRGCVGVGPDTDNTNEDCLSIDVYTPSSARNTSSLPVFLWIQGGGLNSATSHPNGTGLVLGSNEGLVVATITYRTGIYGFLASREIQEGASLNNGLKDQRMAMQWVQEHIRQFGGDPSRVTLGGQSAGAGCLVSHVTAYGGNETDLFHGAIMQSASMPSIRQVSDSQFQFDNLARRVGCDSADDRLQCLRDVPHDTLLSNALDDPFPDGAGGAPVYAYNTVIDDDLVRELPVAAFEEGRFVRVPLIFGDVSDEGNVFTPHNISDAQAARDFLRNTFPRFNTSSLDRVADLYGFSGAEGSDAQARAARAYGDVRYTCPGVQMSSLVAGYDHDQVWNYRYAVPDRNQMSTHGADLGPLFSNRFTGPSQTATFGPVVAELQDFWAGFVESGRPGGGIGAEAGTNWGPWEASVQDYGAGRRLRFDANGGGMEGLSDQQRERCEYLATIATWLEQ